jgi:hypothetical protein
MINPDVLDAWRVDEFAMLSEFRVNDGCQNRWYQARGRRIAAGSATGVDADSALQRRVGRARASEEKGVHDFP